MMKKLLPFLCASALALSLTACAGTINNSTADAASDVTFTFTDSGVIAAGETNTGYEIDGTALTITDSGTYTVSGSCADGSIKVKKGTTGVTLVLDGLTLTSENTAAITCGKSSEVTILVSNGTENSLSDTEQNNDDNYPENENAENAVIKCKDGLTVTLCGDGELAVTANGKNGIKSGATTNEDGEVSLTIRDLTLNIDAPVNDAINAEQLLNVESGTLTIDAADDAIHCDLVLNIGADGTDGPTDAAGGYAFSGDLARLRAIGLHPKESLDANDSYPLLLKAGTLLRTGPTRTNVMDMAIMLVRPK